MLFVDTGFERITAAVPARPRDHSLAEEGAGRQRHPNSWKDSSCCESHSPSAVFSCGSWSKCNRSVYQRLRILCGHISIELSEISVKTGVWIGTLEFCLGSERKVVMVLYLWQWRGISSVLLLTNTNKTFLTVQHLYNGKNGKVFQGSPHFQSRPI